MKAPILKLVCQVFGMALVITGVMWALQGLGVLMWPADSIMLADRAWALYGFLSAALGLVVLLLAARIAR